MSERVTISMTENLLSEIDKLCKKEKRSRSNFIQNVLSQHVKTETEVAA